MTLREKQSKFARDIVKLCIWLHNNGYEFTFADFYRDPAWQKVMVQRGLSKTMNSRHAQRLAADIMLFKDVDPRKAGLEFLQNWKQYEAAGEYWKSLDPANVWGGDWPGLRDAVHFERNPKK